MKQALRLAAVVALAAFPLVSASRPSAQAPTLEFPKASPPSLVRNQIGLTTVEIEYSRPGVKGRTIFGGLLPYGQVWRTGANESTRVTFGDDVTFGGTAVPAGSYALFTIPGKDQWTVMLNSVSGQWGSYAYDKEKDVASIQVKPVTLHEPVETLTIGLAHIRDDSAHLTLEWETTRIAVPIETDLVATLVPQIEAAMAAEGDRKPYLQAAMFFYEHDLDLYKARGWIEAAEAQQPDAVWIAYRKGLILAKMGDTEGALEAATRATQLAKQAGGALGAEYGRLSAALIARLQS